MSSPLGAYVHYKAFNYNNWGIAQREEDPQKISPSVFENHINSRINKLPKVNESTLQTLKQRLMQNSDKNEAQGKVRTDEQFNQYINEVNNLLGNFIDKKILRQTQSSDVIMSQGDPTGGRRSNKAIIEKNKQELIKLKQDMNNINGTFTSEADLQKIINRFNKLTGANFSATGSNQQSILEQIQEMSDSLTFVKASQTLTSGTFSEYLATVANDIVQEKGQDEVDSMLIRNNILASNKGGLRSEIKTYDYTGKEIKVSAKATQDKVDVNLTVNGEDIYASVKNYKTSKTGIQNIHLQNITNLSAVAVKLKSNMVAHWVNLIASRGTVNAPLKATANKAMKTEFAYEAFSHGNITKTRWNKDSRLANVFISFDSTNGNVYVEDIASILRNKLDKVTFSNYEDSLYKANTWIKSKSGGNNKESAMTRNDFLAKAIHSMNISVGYKIVFKKV